MAACCQPKLERRNYSLLWLSQKLPDLSESNIAIIASIGDRNYTGYKAKMITLAKWWLAPVISWKCGKEIHSAVAGCQTSPDLSGCDIAIIASISTINCESGTIESRKLELYIHKIICSCVGVWNHVYAIASWFTITSIGLCMVCIGSHGCCTGLQLLSFRLHFEA